MFFFRFGLWALLYSLNAFHYNKHNNKKNKGQSDGMGVMGPMEPFSSAKLRIAMTEYLTYPYN